AGAVEPQRGKRFDRSFTQHSPERLKFRQAFHFAARAIGVSSCHIPGADLNPPPWDDIEFQHMAASTINTECKRYGCMKNLLACFANCRYTMRCDELRNELADKTAEAESDINRYLSERGRAPVVVQILKRGVKFDDKAGRRPRPAAAKKMETV